MLLGRRAALPRDVNDDHNATNTSHLVVVSGANVVYVSTMFTALFASVVGRRRARALAIVTPGILGPGYFREVAAILDSAVAGPPDFAAIAAVMARHGLTPAP